MEKGIVLSPEHTSPETPSRRTSQDVSPPDTTKEAQISGSVNPSQEDEEDYQYITGIKLATVTACITLVAFLIMLDQSIIATAIPRITSDFHSLPDVGWYGSAYLLASASLQPLTGKVYTYFGSKYTFLSFLAVFELGSLLCGVANSSKMLIVGRAVAGLGSSGLVNGALTIMAAYVPLEKRPVHLGAMMSISQLGILLGPLIGGALTQYTTWRWCFYINLPIGGVAAASLLLIAIPDRALKDSEMSLPVIIREKLDLVGFAIFAPAAVQFLLALQWGGTRQPWNSSVVIGLFCGAAGTFCLFLVWEYRKGDAAMVPFSIIRIKIVWSSCLFIFLFIGAMLSMSYYLPIYFQAVKGVSPTLSGVYLLPSILSQIFLSMLSGYLVGKIGYYLPWAVASAVLSSIGYGLLSTLTPTSSTGSWIGYQIITGVGRGSGLQMGIIAVQSNVSPSQLPVAMAILVFWQTLGGAMILAFSQTAFANSLRTALHTFAPDIEVNTLSNVGASAVKEVVPHDSLDGVLLAYNQALNHVLYLTAGLAAATFLCSWGMGWTNVKKSKKTMSET